MDRVAVVAGSGAATTRIAAFHRSLLAIGVGHLNLVSVSSVVPAGRVVEHVTPLELRSLVASTGVGDVLYCVAAIGFSDNPNERPVSALGYVQRYDRAEGFIAEAVGTVVHHVLQEIAETLTQMIPRDATGDDWNRQSIFHEVGPLPTTSGSISCVTYLAILGTTEAPSFHVGREARGGSSL